MPCGPYDCAYSATPSVGYWSLDLHQLSDPNRTFLLLGMLQVFLQYPPLHFESARMFKSYISENAKSNNAGIPLAYRRTNLACSTQGKLLLIAICGIKARITQRIPRPPQSHIDQWQLFITEPCVFLFLQLCKTLRVMPNGNRWYVIAANQWQICVRQGCFETFWVWGTLR